MPRGLPDYYNPDTLVSQRLANVEEVVTTLRGIASIDNRGRTLYYTKFSEGVNGWELSKLLNGVSPVASTTHAEIEPASMAMDGGTTTAESESRAEKRWRIQDIKKAGIEFSLAFYEDSGRVEVTLTYDDVVNFSYGRVDINQVTKIVRIRAASGWVTLATLPASYTQVDWLPIKLVLDFENDMYLRLLVGLKEYDLSEHALVTAETVVPGLLMAQIRSIAADAGTNISYIGYVGISVDEP